MLNQALGQLGLVGIIIQVVPRQDVGIDGDQRSSSSVCSSARKGSISSIAKRRP
jgi:hypothetical protein